MKNNTILVIEDDIHLKPAYEDKFGGEGFSILWEVTGEGGLDVAKKALPGLILLDLLLPGTMSGMDVLLALKKDPATSGIPVLVLTNVSEEGNTAESAGAVDYLVKANISLAQIVEKIKKYMAS